MEEKNMTLFTAFNDKEYSENILNTRNKELNTTPKENSNENNNNLKMNQQSPESSDDDIVTKVKPKKKFVQQLLNSDSETEDNYGPKKVIGFQFKSNLQIDSEEDNSNDVKNSTLKSRIQINTNSSGDDTDYDSQTKEEQSSKVVIKNAEQQARRKNKLNKLRQKFSNLISSREKDHEIENKNLEDHNSKSSDNSDTEAVSIEDIKLKIKQRTMNLNICDPDTSDEESNQHKIEKKRNNERKSTKLISPKPSKMTAKQAMENMQKIKSESNRMLREKEVSLPYHRPKALSLKDIMSRRKPAVSADGKALPIKMNSEQLKQYILQLEERQKEMIELCRSDTDEEEPLEDTANSENIPSNEETLSNKQTDTNYSEVIHTDFEVTHTNINNDDTNKEEKIEENISVEQNLNDKTTIENCSVENFCSDLEMKLIYNDSVEDANTTSDITQRDKLSEESTSEVIDNFITEQVLEVCTKTENQSITLHYDSKKNDDNTDNEEYMTNLTEEKLNEVTEYKKKISKVATNKEVMNDIEFSDDEIIMDDIDAIIENAEIMKDLTNSEENVSSPMLIKNSNPLNIKPKLTGAPGMVIDLDGDDPIASKKLSGVELLKERFAFFAKLKTQEEKGREREKIVKPGTQHLKLKQELEEKIAEQRSLEWAKRLEEEKEQNTEMDTFIGNVSDVEDDIDKIEAKLENNPEVEEPDTSESEEEELEEDDFCEEKKKERKRNPFIADEAEESNDDDECEESNENGAHVDNEIGDVGCDADADDNDEEDEDSSDDDVSSESETEEQSKPKKGRILKAFEDSDDEAMSHHQEKDLNIPQEINESDESEKQAKHQLSKNSIDDELCLAQPVKSMSENLFTSQESTLTEYNGSENFEDNKIVNINKHTENVNVQKDSEIFNQDNVEIELHCPSKLTIICETQNNDNINLDNIFGLCSGTFPQNLVSSQPTTQVESQSIGEDVLALCTGKFYDNIFLSQVNDETVNNSESQPNEYVPQFSNLEAEKQNTTLKSIDPEFDAPKVNIFFCGNKDVQDIEKETLNTNNTKKKLIIESDDENIDTDTLKQTNKKKFKKKKLEKRALQISDDEENEYSEQEDEEYISDLGDDAERVVEYDSEENEVEVKPQATKKKRKAADFFEQEAELTSEDEWVGSGDEDEAGLDRMEREEGDEDNFNHNKLQRELGQIHMRDVLDQDKRDVRLLQELLFEDGDLGSGSRQRKFRWRNTDGEDDIATVPDALTDTQEEEFESEEQWRKQRHEREMFLKQLQKQEELDKGSNVNINRTTIIKGSLSTNMTSSLLLDVNTTRVEKPQIPIIEKKTSKDIPSPKKHFSMFQQNYHGSFLTRGRGALARLAALATPLVGDGEDGPRIGSLIPSNRRNFVFATISKDDDKPKVTKRKADSNNDTSKLIKKIKTEEQRQNHKHSLLDHIT